MKRITPVSLVMTMLCCVHLVRAQSGHLSVAIPFAGATAYGDKPADPFVFFVNPAALARVDNLLLGVCAEQRFGLAQAAQYRMGLVLPTRQGHFGFGLNRSGIPGFTENGLALGYARHLGALVDLGIRFQYHNRRITEYGNRAAMFAALGMTWHFTDKVYGGLSVENPTRVAWSGGGERLSAVYRAGLGYAASAGMYCSAELIHEEGLPADVLAGIQYAIIPEIKVYAGVRSGLGSYYAGGGIHWRNLQAYLSVSRHRQLGFSPGLLLLLRLSDGHSN